MDRYSSDWKLLPGGRQQCRHSDGSARTKIGVKVGKQEARRADCPFSTDYSTTKATCSQIIGKTRSAPYAYVRGETRIPKKEGAPPYRERSSYKAQGKREKSNTQYPIPELSERLLSKRQSDAE